MVNVERLCHYNDLTLTVCKKHEMVVLDWFEKELFEYIVMIIVISCIMGHRK